MKKLYIHIGYHKTATSSIQFFFSKNRSQLLEDSYLYPETGCIDSAHHLLAISVNKNPLFLSMLEKEPIQYWTEFNKEIEESNAKSIVISSEEFSIISELEKIKQLHNYISDKFEVKIVVYVRRIDYFCESIYKQLIKFYGSRHSEPFDINADYVLNRIDCYDSIKKWGDVFGVKNIIVRVFEKKQLVNNPIYDFLTQVDYNGNLLNKTTTEVKKNSTLLLKFNEIVRIINSRYSLNRETHNSLITLLESLSAGEQEKHSYLSTEERHDLIKKSLHSDEKIAKEFLGRESGILYHETIPQLTKFENNAELDKLVSKYIDIVSNRKSIKKQLPFESQNDLHDFKNKYLEGFCSVCGLNVTFHFKNNLRDSGNCSNCGASNRKRQIAYFLRNIFGIPQMKEKLSLNESITIFNTESSGPLHNILKTNKRYISSEFISKEISPGAVIDGIRHEDLQNLSFEDSSISLMISSDVFEHIPDPYAAHKEVYRVLEIGGRHIFTVPFYNNRFTDEARAIIKDGEIVNLMTPIYHGDPVGPNKKILVFNIFSLEMLVKLEKIGFEVSMFKIASYENGIVGNNAIVFDARKIDQSK